MTSDLSPIDSLTSTERFWSNSSVSDTPTITVTELEAFPEIFGSLNVPSSSQNHWRVLSGTLTSQSISALKDNDTVSPAFTVFSTFEGKTGSFTCTFPLSSSCFWHETANTAHPVKRAANILIMLFFIIVLFIFSFTYLLHF